MARATALGRLLSRVGEARARHRARHAPTGFGFALADRIGYLDAAAWDALTGGASVFLSRGFLQALERAGPSTVRGRYAIAWDGARPLAAIAAQALRIDAARVAPARSGAWRRVRADVLVCGNVLSWGCHGVAFAPGVDPAAGWAAVAEALYRLRRAERLAAQTDFVLIKDLPVADVAAERALATYSYRPLETEPDMVLALDPRWRRYDDYLQGLASRYRKAAVGIAQDFAAAGLTLERLDDVAAHAGPLHALYLAVHGAARVRLATLEPGFLPALAAALGPRFRVTVARRGEQIVGFVSTLLDGETAVGYYIGFDRSCNERAPIYLRLLQAVVADAIELGARRLSLGRTALEPKARLGARPVPTRVFVRHRVPLLNTIVSQALRLVSHDEAPERNPFRK